MTTSEEQLQEWEALVPKLNDDADDHMDVAHSADMRPEHTANYRHAKNAHEAACAIHSLITELREARDLVVALAPDALHEAEERKQILKDSDELWRGRMQDAETAHKAEVAGLEAKLAEAEARIAQVLSVAEKMRCAGSAQEFQYWFDELKSFLLRKQDTSALDAAIAAVKGEKQ